MLLPSTCVLNAIALSPKWSKPTSPRLDGDKRSCTTTIDLEQLDNTLDLSSVPGVHIDDLLNGINGEDDADSGAVGEAVGEAMGETMGESEGEGEEQDEVQDEVQGEGEAGGEAGGEAAGGVPSIEYLRGQLRETRSMVKSLDLGRHNTVFDLNERLLDVFATDDFDTSGRRHLSAAIMELTQYVSDVLAQTDDQGDDAVRATPQPMPALTGSAAARFAVFRRNTRSMLQEIQLRNLLETPMPLGDYLAMINSNISPDMEEFGEEEGGSFLARLQDQGEEVVWDATTATVMSSA